MTVPNETTSYPEPGHSLLNPYPVLTSTESHEDARPGNESIHTPAEDTYQLSGDAYLERYRDLAHRFGANSTGRNDASLWRFPGRDGVGYGAPDTTPREWPSQDTLDQTGTVDADMDNGILGRPRENPFLQSMRNAERGTVVQGSDLQDPSSASDGEGPAPRGRGRGRPRGTARAGRKRGWKQFLKGTTHDPVLDKDDPKRARGTGRRARGRARAKLDPGREFKDHLKTANLAYLKEEYETAAKHAGLAVQANPEVFQAYSLLSDSLEKLGRNQDAAAALMGGAYTTKDPNVWISVAERTLAFAGDQRTEEDIDQALFCYSTAMKMQSDPYDVRAARLSLLIEKEDWPKARLEAKALHRMRPTDIDNKKTYAELCVMTEEHSEMARAKDAYETAFAARTETDLTPDEVPEYWSHLNIYLDLVDRVGTPEEALGQLKRIARWILGRKDESSWDRYVENDCEFDCGRERRGYIPEFQQGIVSADQAKYGDSLPLELRVKFGIFRMRMGLDHLDEALRHFSVLAALVTEIDSYYDMFFQVGEILKEYSQFTTAMEFYKPILNVPDVADVELFMSLGACYLATESYSEAIDCFKEAASLDESRRDVRLELMKAYSATGQHEAAMQVYNEAPPAPEETSPSVYSREISAEGTSSEDESSVRRNRRSKRPAQDRSRSKPLKKSARGSSARKPYSRATEVWQGAKEQETEAFRLYTELRYLWPLMTADPENRTIVESWMSVAAPLLKLFQEMPIFYPKHEKYFANRGMGPLDNPSIYLQKEMQTLRNKLEKQAGRTAPDERDEADEAEAPPQLGLSMPSGFLNISFPEWHRVFVEYALLTARLGQQQASYDTVQKGMFKANVFYYNLPLHNTSLATAICVANMYNDSHWLHTLARKYITSGDYHAGMTFQLAAGLARLSYGPNYYATGPSQKFMLRMVKIQDGLGMTEEMRSRADFGLLRRALDLRVEKYGSECELDAGLLLLYGHQVSSATQSYSAIPYYLRSLALQPDSACTHLSMAVMQIQNAMKRQTENRHYGITMGLAFLARYRDIRLASGRVSHLQETKYNTGRIWHALGLTDLAIPCYEEALALSEQVREELAGMDGDPNGVEDFATEAAFALRSIYTVVGNHDAAMRITEEWLVL